MVCLVELKNSGVEVPTQIVEADVWVPDELFNVLEVFLFEVGKAHHDISDLHPCIVDVVLHFHLVTSELEQANEGVAQNRITQMPDVGSLVGVDAGVLDNDLAWARGQGRLARGPQGK